MKGHWLRVLGPYLAVDLLDEGLAILILLLVLADLLELLDRKAVELLHDVLYSQVLVVHGLQGTEDGGLKLLLPGGLLSPPQDLLGLLGGLLGYPEPLVGHLLGSLQSLPGYLLGGLQPLLGGPLEGPHALLHVGERREELPVSPHPLLRESPIALLLLAYAPREGLGSAHVLLGLLAQNLRGIAHPALHELGVALLELQEPYAVGEELLSRPDVVLLQLHELEPVVGKPDAATLGGSEVLGEGLVGVALDLSHLAGGTRRLVDVSGGRHGSTSMIDSKSLLLCSYHTYVQYKPRGVRLFVFAPIHCNAWKWNSANFACVGFSEVRSLRFASFLEEAEPPSHVARGRGLQDERGDHGEGNQGDCDLRTLDTAGEQQACHGSRDDPRVAGPAEEGEFLSRPAPALVRQKASQDGHRSRYEDEDSHHQQTAEQVLTKRLEGQVHAERDEDQERGYLRDLADEVLQQRLVLLVLAEAEGAHVADHEPHHEGCQVARPADVLVREVSKRHHGEDRHARGLVPDAGPRRRRYRVAEDQPRQESYEGAYGQLLGELPGRTGEGELSGLNRPHKGKGEYRPGGVVEPRLRDERLGDLRSDVETVEEGDENCGVGRGQHRADHQRDREGYSEDRGDDQGDDHCGYEHPRQSEQAQTHADP